MRTSARMLLFRYCPTIADKINPIPKTFLGCTSMLSFGIGGCCPVAFATSFSMSPTVFSASSFWPCVTSHRGLSGTKRRSSRMPRPSAAPMPKPAPPADIWGEQALIEQERNSKRSCRCAEPETTVDDEVDTTAILRWNKLIDCGIDRRVLAADAEPGDHPKNCEAPEIPSKRTQQHA